MKAGSDKTPAQLTTVFWAAPQHYANIFTNRRVNRIKVLVHDGFGLWLCARRLYRGRFVWTDEDGAGRTSLSRAQFEALVIGLPWQYAGAEREIALV